MAYKRSTSFSGFRSRLSPDESREIANAAKAADKNRIETQRVWREQALNKSQN